MTLKTKPKSARHAHILDIYDADLPEGQPRVIARCDMKTGQLWRTRGPLCRATMPQIREAVRRAA